MRDFKDRLSVLIAILGLLAALGGCRHVSAGADAPLPAADRGKSAACLIRIVETDQGFAFFEGNQKVLFYQRKPKSRDGKYTRNNYVHPLYGLDGEVLTEDFPSDHLHHRGIFWAWHQIWVGDKKVGDGWSLKDFVLDVCDAKILAEDSQSRALQVQVLWKSPLWVDSEGRQKAFVKETTIIRVHRASGDICKVDFEIRLLALEEGARIGGANNEKAYGGFSTRIRLPEGIRFTGSNGTVEPARTPVEGGPWLDFSGDFGGPGKRSGLAILCHSSLPGYPQKWILRRRGSMQNPVYPGREAILLSRVKPLVLRYRLIVHRGDARHVDLDELQAQYNSEYQ